MDELERLETHCVLQIQLLKETLENHRFMSNHRKQMIKGEIMGVDKVLGQIRRMLRERGASNVKNSM